MQEFSSIPASELDSEYCLITDNPYEGQMVINFLSFFLNNMKTDPETTASDLTWDITPSDDFFSQYNWASEKAAAADIAQYCLSGRVSVDDMRPYLLPQRVECTFFIA